MAQAYADGMALQECPRKYGIRLRIGKPEQPIKMNDDIYARDFWGRVAYTAT